MNKVYCVEDKQYINQVDVKKFKITGKTEKFGSVRCAVLKVDGDNNTYLKPWEQIVNFHQPGEKNVSAKLTTKQVREIVKEVYTKTHDETTFVALAKRYNVSPATISNIAHGRAWRHVTRGLIYQLVHHNKEVLESCISASNEMKRKTTKLSPSLAKFIVRDHFLNKISRKKLADKYLMSEAAIRKVVTGKAWKETTIPAIKEFSNWV